MNVCIRNTFVSLWLVFGTVTLSAQGPCFYFPLLDSVNSGAIAPISLPLKVVNLDSVVSMQFAIRWDPKVLQYHSIVNFNFSNLSIADINISRALDSGYVRLQWEGPSSLPPGASVPDSSTIFRIRFKAIGPDTSSSPVKITELLNFPPTYYEVVKVEADSTNEDYLLSDCPPQNGFVAIGFGLVSASEPTVNEIPLTLAPNPFSVSAQLNFILDETADTQVFITDVMGRIVFQKNFFKCLPGQHGMVIENSMLAAPGVYSLTVQAGRKIATRSFVTF